MIFLLSGLYFSLKAQDRSIELSSPFPEPLEMDYKLLQCHNGNTFLIQLKKFGIGFRLYGKDRKLIKEMMIPAKFWRPANMKGATIEGVYEIAGKLDIFFAQENEQVPAMYRIEISTDDGAVIDQQKIHTVAEQKSRSIFSRMGGLTAYYRVTKDPSSDHYAVIFINDFTDETNKRIEALIFDENHKLLKYLFYKPVDDKFKYVDYAGSALNGTRLLLCTDDYNTRSSGGKENNIVISESEMAADTFRHHVLNIETDLKGLSCTIRFQGDHKKVHLLTYKTGDEKQKNLYDVCLNAGDLSPIYINAVSQERLSADGREKHGAKKDFHGTPINYLSNDDNSTTILLEEHSKIDYNSGGHGITTYAIENIGVMDMDENGKVANAYQSRKCQASKKGMNEMQQVRQENTQMSDVFKRNLVIGDDADIDFYSFNYARTQSATYIIYNTHPDNFSSDDEKKSNYCISGITGTQTICLALRNGQWVKGYLWGEPNSQFDNRFTSVGSSHFDKRTGTYAALIIDQKGKRKQALIAWTNLK